MERRDFVKIGDVLRDCLEQSRMTGRLDESEACRLYADVVGADIAAMCGKPYIHRGVMTVKVTNAALRQELNMRRGNLRDHINEIIGKQTVTEVVFR